LTATQQTLASFAGQLGHVSGDPLRLVFRRGNSY
jgi:hypothetical protein